jgi:signal transduction histidine kinase/ligand-binding sensor domain-containing protein
LAACAALAILFLSVLIAQNTAIPTPSPTPTPTVAPSASPTPSPTPAPGAQNFHQWGSVTLFNGLPSDNVRAIAQTADGVMLFGTDSGLAKFDGRRIETVPLGDRGALKVLAIEAGTNSALWVGTASGVFRYSYGQAEKIGFGDECPQLKELLLSPINAISSGERVLMASSAGVLFEVDAKNCLNPLSPGTDDRYKYTGLARSTSGTVLSTYGSGITRIQGKEQVALIDRPMYVNTVAQDGDRIWIGADSGPAGSGLYVLNEKEAVEQIGTGLGNVMAIEPDNQGGAWVGTAKSGLYYFRGNEQIEHFTFENTSGGLRSNTINSVFLDREGVVWIGTPRGVCRYDSSSPFIQTLSDNANSNFVRTLYRAADGQIFAGTNKGLFVQKDHKWEGFGSFPGRTVYAIGEDPSGRMLIGGPAGTFDIQGQKLADGDTRAFANFRGKTYAAIFDRGLQAIGDQKAPSIFTGTPTSLYETPDKLCIGTAASDVFTFDGQTTRPEPGFANQQLGAIWRIAPRGNGELWIACTKGLFLYNNGALSRVVPNYDVRDIIADGSDVWAATQNGGLLHIGLDELFGWVVSDLNVEQGLPSQQVFSLLREDKRLLVGTNRGVVNYTPGTVLPKVVVSRVLSRRLHGPEEWAKTIELEYPQNSLVVEVAGQSSRTFPEQFQYAFVVKSSKGEILEKRLSHDAQFAPAGLPPGTYTIEAKAFNKDLLFSDPVTIGFAVPRAPFPWTATALGILLIIALVALLLAVAERRQLAQRNRELATARLDLANEAERERRRIARDLHDQTLADLRNLMMMSDKISPENSEFRAEIESVSTEVRRICEDLSPSVLENVGLVAALEFLVSHTIEDHKFSAAEGIEEQIEFPLNAQLQIYRIAQEILTNIVRHSSATNVEMEISVSEAREFVMQISDNGAPFDPDAGIKSGRGISNIRSRASLVDAGIGWEPGEAGGTRFSLRKALE